MTQSQRDLLMIGFAVVVGLPIAYLFMRAHGEDGLGDDYRPRRYSRRELRIPRSREGRKKYAVAMVLLGIALVAFVAFGMYLQTL